MSMTMFPSIAVAKVLVGPEALDQVDQIVQQVAMESMSSDRNEALSLWEDVDAPGSHLAIASSLEDAPHDHAWDRVERIAGVGACETAFGVADLHPMLPHRVHGLPARRIEVGQFASISTRRADPGRDEDLLDEMEGIFESLRYIDGYLGSAIGPNAALPEEVIGLVFWRDLQAYEDSGPRKGLYEIRLFRRVI